VTIYTGFNVTLEGPFHETMTVESESPEGITLGELYRTLLRLPGKTGSISTGFLLSPCGQ
jgi:hypothetical protein